MRLNSCSLSVIKAEFFGIRDHGVKRVVRLKAKAFSIRENVMQSKASVGANHVMRDLASLNLFDEERAAHVEQFSSLNRR